MFPAGEAVNVTAGKISLRTVPIISSSSRMVADLEGCFWIWFVIYQDSSRIDEMETESPEIRNGLNSGSIIQLTIDLQRVFGIKLIERTESNFSD